MKAFVVAIALVAMPLAVFSWPGGAPRCLFVPAGHVNGNGQVPDFTEANPSDFTFGVVQHNRGPLKNMVEVSVSTTQKYKGLLITTDFVTESTTKADNADLSDGVWVLGAHNANGFKLVNDQQTATPGCGVTHSSKQEKTGKHSFLFKPSNNAWKTKGFRVLIVSDPKEIFHQFHIDA